MEKKTWMERGTDIEREMEGEIEREREKGNWWKRNETDKEKESGERKKVAIYSIFRVSFHMHVFLMAQTVEYEIKNKIRLIKKKKLQHKKWVVCSMCQNKYNIIYNALQLFLLFSLLFFSLLLSC